MTLGPDAITYISNTLGPANGGSLPIQIKPFQYFYIIEPLSPWNASGFMKAYTGGAPEHLYFYAASDINNKQIIMRYLVNNVKGRVFINLSCLLEGWKTYGGSVQIRLQHTNASNVTADLYTFAASYADSDVIYTDDTGSAVGLRATFTGRDILTVLIDGAGNTGLIKASFFGISICGV
jgi:hypothetical protein